MDYRKLNHHTKNDAQPLPKIEETLETLSGATWFSTLDLASGYWQVEVADEDKEKTAFTTPFGLYQFRVMPFGLCNAPATFQRLMETVLCGLHWTTCMVYLDDIIVFSKDATEHLEKLDEVFSRLQGAGLKIKPTKCQLFQEKPDPEKIKAVEQWPTPRCAKELQQFLGLASYYRRFVKGFAQLAEPLHRLSEKGKQWNWTDQCEKAFAFLKTQLTKQPVLAHPNFKILFVVDTDASGDGLGAVLSQIIAGQERVVAFASRTLSKTERKYCATRREMLALVWALKQFRCFLYGRRFTVRTDHGSLTWLRNFKEPEGQVARWEACEQCGQNTSTPCAAVSSIMRKRHKWEPSLIWPVWTPTQLEIAQEKDQDIAQMRKWVASKIVPTRCPPDSSRTLQSLLSQKDQMIIKDGILFRRRLATHVDHRAGYQFVVPQILRQEILHGLPSGPEGGHLGKKKTLWKVRQRFHWPDLSEDVADWCRKCQECSQRKNGSKRHQGQLQPHTAPYPMSRIGVDIIGPFQWTERGNRYILTVQDYFSKWPEAYPIPDMTANTVARTLVNEFICRYGAPESLHSDQGRNFEAALIKELCETFDIHKTRTTPYHPQSNGLVERFHRTLLAMLSARATTDRRNWDLVLPMTLLAYRTSIHESTKATPCRILFGREAALPIDVMYGLPEIPPQTRAEYIWKLRNDLADSCKEIREKLKTESRRQKKWYDRGTTDYKFNIDDKVWLALSGRYKVHDIY
ncbi:retrovirus-related Pol polyprotein from transposon 412 [Trichinella spiralis]|uniref:retrovirus-related Pol polyprotein from transposon 412 n=1 Tax=Trichinella spiralis TaxID=6334 RepID=UPI0001EFE1FB|nr:retrovirus-related Pol polyprotein from transposon 412 [Trichinella spiralis]